MLNRYSFFVIIPEAVKSYEYLYIIYIVLAIISNVEVILKYVEGCA